jgi:hypothetical protein
MSRPEKGTPEWDLWVAAIDVAVYPPTDPKHATVYVSVAAIAELRRALEACGIGWRAVKASGR